MGTHINVEPFEVYHDINYSGGPPYLGYLELSFFGSEPFFTTDLGEFDESDEDALMNLAKTCLGELLAERIARRVVATQSGLAILPKTAAVLD